MKNFFMFVLAIVISFIPGIIGVAFTPSHSNDAWYNALSNSVLTPDGWVFGVAWTILYAILGVALFLVMKDEKTRQSRRERVDFKTSYPCIGNCREVRLCV